MNIFVVVNQKHDWPSLMPNATVVSAREYLSDASTGENRPARVLNLCRTDRYQGRGYYVSLLAEARGHRPLPEVKTIGNVQTDMLRKLMSGSFNDQIQRWLAHQEGDSCIVDSYFGRDPSNRNDALSQQLFALLKAPLIRTRFDRVSDSWRLADVQVLSAADIGANDRAFVAEAATEYLSGKRKQNRETPTEAISLAILHNEDEPDPPSNTRALEQFRSIANAWDPLESTCRHASLSIL